MTLFARISALIVLAAGLASCGGDATDQAGFRIINAVVDAPAINFTIDGATVVDNNFTSLLDYRAGTGFIFVTPRSYAILGQELLFGRNGQVYDPLPPEATVLSLPNFQMTKGTEYSLITVGRHAATADTILLENPLAVPAPGQFQVQVVNGDPDTVGVNVYLTAPLADLSVAVPFATLGFKGYTTAQQLPEGDYQLRVTRADDPGTVLFDGGVFTFNEGNSLLLVLMKNLAPGPSPISIAVNNGLFQSQVFNVGTPAQVRTINASPDSPPLVVTATDTSVDAGPPVIDHTRVLADNLAFTDVSDYVDLIPDTFNIAAATVAAPATKLFEFAASPFVATRTTLVILDLIDSIRFVNLVDDIRSVITEGKLRIVNASVEASPVDVYASLPGVPINQDTAVFQGLVFGGSTSFLALAIGPYHLTFVKAGQDPTVAANIFLERDVDMTAGSVKQVMLRDTVGGVLPAEIIETIYNSP